MLDDAIRTQLKSYLERLVQPIELGVSLDGSEAAERMRGLLDDVAGLSDLISVSTKEGGTFTPSFTIGPKGGEARVRFAGLPLGHEFNSFILALLNAGGVPVKQPSSLLDQVRALQGPLHFETFYSLSCQNCPDVVQALNIMALVNPAITHTAIDGAAFEQEVETRGILAVPAVFLNGKPFAQGRMTLEDIVARLDQAAPARNLAELNTKAPYDVLIVGGGPAGAAASIYEARKGILTGIAGARFVGPLLETMCIVGLVSV
ncbi:MAG: thioredoxin family protein, partial [Alphaproteobacteria bacterium]